MRLSRLGVWVAVVGLGCGDAAVPDATRSAAEPVAPAAATQPPTQPAPIHVGRIVCAGCHPDSAEAWQGSHHDLAMQEADAATLLGDFSAPPLEHRGERFTFQNEDGRHGIRTAGPDGAPADFEVLYSFGAEPLQQYLVALPDGRLQAVGVAWDSRPAEEGGQRWFHLQPDEEVPPGDVLHWTGLAGSWNSMCADCHSTGLAKGYDAADDRFQTTWQELDVSCEACHGPGSAHVSWAQQGEAGSTGAQTRAGGGQDRGNGLVVDLANEAEWRFEGDSAIAQRVPPRASDAELETCAPCHSRRSRIAFGEDAGARFLDHYRPALLEAGLYHADGQILDEVYVWGSFLQSRMHAAGVTCSDCHDPHRLRIDDPDAACATCHRSDVFAAASHHHHEPGSSGASCVSCHMPARTYMVVDDRRDHGFRVPRPDLTESLGVPNACSGCHADRPASWAAEATARWFGEARAAETHFATVLDAGRRRLPGASAGLAGLALDPEQPAIVRGSALELLPGSLDAVALRSLLEGLRDPAPLVRLAAARRAEVLPARDRARVLAPLLRDPLRAVRIEAARSLASELPRVTHPGLRRDLTRALEEYEAAQVANAERPEAHVNLGLLHHERAAYADAQREYEIALRLQPSFVPAAVNLADLERLQGHPERSEAILREALTRAPDNAELHHSLGLLLAGRQRMDEAIAELGRAAELAPWNPRMAYVYGVGLHSMAGQAERGFQVLGDAHRAHPGDLELLVALATLHRDAGQRELALEYARKLLALQPGDPASRSLVAELEAR